MLQKRAFSFSEKWSCEPVRLGLHFFIVIFWLHSGGRSQLWLWSLWVTGIHGPAPVIHKSIARFQCGLSYNYLCILPERIFYETFQLRPATIDPKSAYSRMVFFPYRRLDRKGPDICQSRDTLSHKRWRKTSKKQVQVQTWVRFRWSIQVPGAFMQQEGVHNFLFSVRLVLRPLWAGDMPEAPQTSLCMQWMQRTWQWMSSFQETLWCWVRS